MNKHKILFIDDDLNIRESTTELLIYKNYEVKSASNGQEALDLLDNWIPDLILCDIMMPVMDGYTLHEIIKENAPLVAIPFIFLTAKKENNLMRKCMFDGVDDFISKPFKVKELLKIIETKIDRFQKIKNVHNNLYLGDKKYFLHEVNTPLNGIMGSIDLLLEHSNNLEKGEITTFYNAIKTSGERLNRTMQNLILYESLKNNELNFSDDEHCEVLNIFFETKKKILSTYKNQEKRITFEIDKSNLKISKANLQFILFELIDNALKFSPNSTIIIVSGEKFDDKYYELVIRDFGIGFSEEELKTINAAQQFNRDEREQQGLGLGLYLSKTIIKKIKGVFSIISNEKKGTKISLFLPLSPE
jgi:two-component system sensor histidine kinase/response regulator